VGNQTTFTEKNLHYHMGSVLNLVCNNLLEKLYKRPIYN
jgi:hypothetical protein